LLHHKTYTHPDSDQWVTFIHGAGGSSAIWYKQIKDFKQHFNVLLIDLRGHGNSKTIKLPQLKKYTFRAITKEVVDVLDHLKISSSHFVGISLGTIIIRELAEMRPKIVSSMILGGAIMKMNFRSQILMNLGFMLRSIVPYILLYKLFAFIIMPKDAHKESRNLFVREAKKLYQKEFIRWFGLTKSINPILRLFRAKDPLIPSLYIMGDQDYMFLPPVQHIVKQHKFTSLTIFEDCGHVVNVDKPRLFNKTVIEWINTFKLKSWDL